MNRLTVTQEEWVLCALQEYEGMLLGYARQLLGSHDRAQDVVQDTFIKLCQQKQENVERYLKRWLFKVCRNRALEILRKEKRMVGMSEATLSNEPSRAPAPDAGVTHQDEFAHALRLIEDLPEKQQEVIHLKFQHNMSYKEISEIADVSVSNVGFLLHTALQNLRRQMQASEVQA